MQNYFKMGQAVDFLKNNENEKPMFEKKFKKQIKRIQLKVINCWSQLTDMTLFLDGVPNNVQLLFDF